MHTKTMYLKCFGVRLNRRIIFIIAIMFAVIFILSTIFKRIGSIINSDSIPILHLDDIKEFVKASKEANIKFILFDPFILEAWKKNPHLNAGEACVFLCHSLGPLSLAVYSNELRNMPKLLESLSLSGFSFYQFFSLEGKATHVVFIRRTSSIHVTILHWRTAGYWRQYKLIGQPHPVAKMKEFVTMDSWNAMSIDRAYERFATEKTSIDGIDMTVPSKLVDFSMDVKSSQFIPCNETRATYFNAVYPEVQSPETIQFEHAAWKTLSKAKTILDQLKIPFWISSGTCLGFFRQCKIIPWSMDVDIGIFINDYNPSLVPNFESGGLKLVHQFGKPEDSFELSFIVNGIKLDIFFFYKEGAFIWNGGTQVKTGKKFKYVFPPFTLCWTEFLELKLRIPCQTEEYIKANYGEDWFTPLKQWDWKSNPNNVKDNGRWSEEDREKVIVIKKPSR